MTTKVRDDDLQLVWESLALAPFSSAEELLEIVNEDVEILDLDDIEEALDLLCDRGMAHMDEGADGETVYLAGPGGGFCEACSELDEKLAHALIRLHVEADRSDIVRGSGLIRGALDEAAQAYVDEAWSKIVTLLVPVSKYKTTRTLPKIKQAAASVVAWAKKLDAREED